MSIAEVYAAGNVRRYHANPQLAHICQTNADHQGRCVQLLFALHPEPSADLIRAVAHHDVAERWVGDLPYFFKQQNPEVAQQHAQTEAAISTEKVGPIMRRLTATDRDWLTFIDRLEAWAWCALHHPIEAQRNGWPEQRHNLQIAAELLGGNALAERAALFIQDMTDARF